MLRIRRYRRALAMDFAGLITPEDALAKVRAMNKADALQQLCHMAGRRTKLDPERIYELMAARERLGSTGVGHGVALPHSSIPGLTQLHGVVASLHRPIDFGSVDAQPIDLIFMLLIPAGSKQHLPALAAVSRRLRETAVIVRLRNAPDARHIDEAFTGQTLALESRA